MENTKRFVELAIKGGWRTPWLKTEFGGVKSDRGAVWFKNLITGRNVMMRVEVILLDRDAWTAVGRAVDTGIEDSAARRGEYVSFDKFDWRLGWIGFTHLLADGKTIDEALGELLPG